MSKVTVSSGGKGWTADFGPIDKILIMDVLDQLRAERGDYPNEFPITITAAGRKATIPSGKLNQIQERVARDLGYL